VRSQFDRPGAEGVRDACAPEGGCDWDARSNRGAGINPTSQPVIALELNCAFELGNDLIIGVEQCSLSHQVIKQPATSKLEGDQRSGDIQVMLSKLNE
jgi:hypothetical protein